MINGENTTIISYKIHNGQGKMLVFPLVHSRNFHAASELPDIRQEPGIDRTVLQSSTKLTLFSDRASYMPQEMKNIEIKPRTGFEPATSSLPRTRYTGLSYRGAKSPLC
jgi:hypothetical protein